MRFDASRGELDVVARFAAQAGGRFLLESGAEPYVVEPEASRDGVSFAPMERRGRALSSSRCAPCVVRYRFALARAARKIDDLDVASDEGPLFEAPPSTWLFIPAGAPASARVRFRVATTDGARFVTGVFPSRDAAGAWDMRIDDLWSAPYSAFGPMRARAIEEGGSRIELAIGEGELGIDDDALDRWVRACARAVAGYLGRFPMPNALVLLVPGRGRWVGGGRTLSGGGGTVFMRIGERATTDDLRSDWVLVHEMTHLAFPNVPKESAWAEEGLATYVEPFARARAGLLSEEEAWRGLVEGLPHGLPRPGDRGLDRTPTWGRTYWGGALFFLLADIEIRKRTNLEKGLEDALRGLLDAGGTNAVRWPVADAFAAADASIGVTVLTDLHAKMGSSPHPVDLAALTRELGIVMSNGEVRFDDAAPLARVRRAITTGRRD